MRNPIALRAQCLLPLMILLAPFHAAGYSVLTHEAIIDTAWLSSIRPLLAARFPQATAQQLRDAHAYAYGGAIIQDFGYYPHGSHLFSDLAHYLRSGVFIVNLIDESQTLEEYAFALGSLAHYAADEQGHSVAVNPSVALLYPKLAQKFGPVVTYEDDKVAHLKTEFAFDVVQVARGYYAPEAYHDFVGFNVSKPVLERAFERTYCLRPDKLFSNLERALNTYRHVVSRTLPRATEVAWVIKKDEIQQHLGGTHSQARRKFIYNLSRASYEKEWGKNYDRPSALNRFLAFLIRLLPKVGPLRALAFRTPTPQAEDLFMKSFDLAVDEYKTLLREVGEHRLRLRELNLDTGKPARPGDYELADETVERWKSDLAGVACPSR